MWAESVVGQGSTFHFTVILLRAQAQAVFKAESKLKKTMTAKPADAVWAGPPLHVLVVEDDPSSRMLAGGVLRKAGHSVSLAVDADEALQFFEKEVFDAVLMDIQLPGMDGISATKIIRERDRVLARKTAIVALTAFAMKGDRERFLAAGMDGYVAKPFDKAELFTELRRAIDKHQAASAQSPASDQGGVA